MDGNGVRERGKSLYRAALTTLEGNEEKESEERCKWALHTVAAIHHTSDSPSRVTASLTF